MLFRFDLLPRELHLSRGCFGQTDASSLQTGFQRIEPPLKLAVGRIQRQLGIHFAAAAEINNPNDITPQAATAQLLTGATVTNIGQLTVAATYSEGNASNQGQGNSQAKLGEQIIMAPNTTYLLRITSLDTAVQNINAYVSWFEDDTYLA